jgi:Right handed beta helix region
MLESFRRTCLLVLSTALIVLAIALFTFKPLGLSALAQTGARAGRADFYVSLEGKDSWSGTLEAPNAAKSDGPFATLDRARRAVHDLKKGSRNTPIVVMVRGGTYFLPAPLKFERGDSGKANAPIVYDAYPGEKPVISGGKRITGWSNPSGNTWTVKLNSNEYQNFEALYFNDERRYRPRTTDNSYLYIQRPVLVSERSETCSQPPPQPGGGEGGGRPGQGQGRRPGGGPGGGGGGRPPFGGGRRPGGMGGRFPFPFPGGGGGPGGQGPRGGQGGQGRMGEGGFVCFDRFYYKGDDIASNYHSMALGDVEILDFEKWTMSRLRLKSVDTDQHIAYTTGPTFLASNISGFFPNHRYLIENVKEALKKPGEWYLDRCTDPPSCTNSDGTWTLTYLAKPGENPNQKPVIIPQLPQLLVAEGLEYVTFKGLTFSHDNYLPGPEGLGDFQGGPKVPGALSFVASSHIVFDGVIVAHTQGWGIDFSNASLSNQVVNSALYDIGYGAIRIGRRTSNGGDSEDQVPGMNVVENNLIVGGGRFIPSGIGTGVWIGNAHNNTVTHNEISDYYGGAIRIGFKLNITDGIGNAHDNLVSFNHVYNLGQGVTSDFSGVYASTSNTKGNQILNNVIHDIVNDPGPGGYGGVGLYFDQGASNILAKNNLIYRISQAGLFINFNEHFDGDTPQNDVVTNNIFAFFGKRLLQRGGSNRSTFTFTHNIVYFNQSAMQANNGKWLCFNDCPSRFFMDYNLYWSPKGTKPEFLTSDENNPRVPNTHDLREWQRLGEDSHSIVADPMFVNPNSPADDFTLKSGSPALQIGFVPFDPRQAGRSHPILKAPPVPPAFPLQLLDPNEF